MHVSLTSKYGSRVLLMTYTAIFGLHRYLIKKSHHNDKLLSSLPKQCSAFVCFANLLVIFGVRIFFCFIPYLTQTRLSRFNHLPLLVCCYALFASMASVAESLKIAVVPSNLLL